MLFDKLHTDPSSLSVIPTSSTLPGLHLCSLSCMPENRIRDLLHDQGFLLQEQAASDLWVVVVDTLGDPRLSVINQEARKTGKSWFLFKPVGEDIEYTFITKDSACWHCFEKRHRLLDAPASYLYSTLNQEHPIIEPTAVASNYVEKAFKQASHELKRLLVSPAYRRVLQGKLCVLEKTSPEIKQYPIVRLPFCPTCSTSTWPRQFPDPLTFTAEQL